MSTLLSQVVRHERLGSAVGAAARAATVGEAFLAGYRNALWQLVPTLPRDRNGCLCATESGGAHPRAIQATLAADGTLNGNKKWVTGAPLADLLLVVASTGKLGERNQLRVALVDAHAPGVTLVPMPPTPFIPEIPHAEVSFTDVRVTRVLDGDGYERYLKPFRTVEDTFVFAAVLGHLFGRSATWPRPYRERLLAVLATLDRCAAGDPSAPEIHLMLAGALALGRTLADEAATYLGDEERARWQRDAVLLTIAQTARDQRSERAWSSFS